VLDFEGQINIYRTEIYTIVLYKSGGWCILELGVLQ
jgi:hypothetical protein